LDLSTIETKAMDSRKLDSSLEKESFDRILLDAPCSGFGVMRRKPDMKYTKTEADVDRLQKIQLDLLASVSSLLKKGGLLVYSTCTIDKAENEEVVEKLLADNSQFERDLTLGERLPADIKQYTDGNELQILPQYFGSDGFYIAALRKKVQ